MAVTIKDVDYVAGLARLEFTDAEKEKLTMQLNKILEYMEKLNELDTSGVEPMTQVLYEADPTATLREDREHQPLPNSLAVANAPQAGAGFFKVPKVIER